MVFIEDNNLINKSGKKLCCQIMAPQFVNKKCDLQLNNFQI